MMFCIANSALNGGVDCVLIDSYYSRYFGNISRFLATFKRLIALFKSDDRRIHCCVFIIMA